MTAGDLPNENLDPTMELAEASMKLYGSEGMLLMEVELISAADRTIQIKGKMMGQVPMKVIVRPSDLREAFTMLSFHVVWEGIKMLFTPAARG